MGIRFNCPNGHKLNVKEFLAGKRGVCPECGAKFVIPSADRSNGPMLEMPAGAASGPFAGFPPVRETAPVIDASSPSVVISLVDSAFPPPQPAAAPASPQIIPPVASSAPAAAFEFSALPTAPAPMPASDFAARRARGRRLQMQLAVVLFLAVIVLAGVLTWVLLRDPNAVVPEPEPTSTTNLAFATSQAYVAEANLLSKGQPASGL